MRKTKKKEIEAHDPNSRTHRDNSENRFALPADPRNKEDVPDLGGGGRRIGYSEVNQRVDLFGSIGQSTICNLLAICLTLVSDLGLQR
jgi:hypothetical protein